MQNDTSVSTGPSGSGWSMALGILMVGVWHLIFVFHSHSFGGVLWQLLLAVVYGFAGVYMLMHPLLGLVTLTFVIAIFLFVEAGIETALYFTIRRKTNAGWVLF